MAEVTNPGNASAEAGAVPVPAGAAPAAGSSGGWTRPLRLHLSIVIITLLVISSVPAMWLNYEQGRRTALAAAEEQMSLLAQHTIDRYRSVFGDGYATATMASAVASLRSPPTDDLEAKTAFLIKAIQGSPYIDGLFVGFADGGFLHGIAAGHNPRWLEALKAPAATAYGIRSIARSPTGAVSTWRFLDEDSNMLAERSTTDVGYDPRQRPWYKAAQGGEAVSVGPYVTATTKSLALTLAVPTADKTTVIGVDVLLETISRLLQQEAVSEHARGYVFDGQKKLIVHSDPAIMNGILESYLSTPKTAAGSAATDPALDAVREQLRVISENQSRTVRFQVGDAPYIARISSVGFSDLLRGNTIVIAAPLSDFTGAADRLLSKSLVFAGIVLLAGIVAALLVARLVTRALQSLTDDARQIGNLDFEGHSSTRSWITEINTLAGSLAAAREAIRTFALYVPRELVRRIVTAGQASAGQAVRQEVTVLFTDIRDFTTISERHSPEDVVGMLSDYFQLMNGIVERHRGVIIQYLGDSIYAMWNAPVADPTHVDDACACALELKQAIDDLNERKRKDGRPELVTRFGINTGVAVVGSVGAEARRQYTAMGDTVNVASRLEGMNKQFGTTILVSEAVYDRSSESFRFRSLGAVQAKGRSEQIEIFELTGSDPA